MPKAKPISLQGLSFETVIDTLLKTEPQKIKKPKKKKVS